MLTRIQDRTLPVLAGTALIFTLLALPGIHWIVTVAAIISLAVLAAVHPQIMVAVVVLSIPVQSEILMPFVRGELTLTQLTIFGLILGWGALFWRRRIWLDAVVVGFLLVLAAYAVSFVAVDNPSNWFQESYRWAIAGVFYLICRSVISEWQHVRMILWAMLLGVAGVSAASAYQFVVDAGPGAVLVRGNARVYASFGTPNTLAAYLEMTVPVLLACIPIAWIAKSDFQFSRVQKWLLVLIAGFGLAALALTQSRGGLIGMLAALAVIWWQLPNRARVSTATVAVLVFVGFLMTSPGQAQLSRFAEIFDVARQDNVAENSRSAYEIAERRGALWQAAQSMLADKPFTGVGAGEFDTNHREYVDSWIDRFPRGQAHNVWLQMGAQAGIWGILAYAWWFFASVWGVITARRRVNDPQRVWLLTGVLAVFAAYTLHSLVDYLNVLSLGLQLSVLTAIALNLAPEPLSRCQTKGVSPKSQLQPETASCP